MKNAKQKEKQTQTKTSSTKVTASSPTPKSDPCNECITLGAVTSVILIFSLLFGGYYYFTNPDFEEGNCVVSRDYKYFRVQDLDEDDEYYELVELKPHESLSGWYLTRNYEGEQRYKSFESADESYVEIPCYR